MAASITDNTAILDRMAATTWGRAHDFRHNGYRVTHINQSPRSKAAVHFMNYPRQTISSHIIEFSENYDDLVLRVVFQFSEDETRILRLADCVDSDSDGAATSRRIYCADGVSYEEHRSLSPDRVYCNSPAYMAVVGGMAAGNRWIDIRFRGDGRGTYNGSVTADGNWLRGETYDYLFEDHRFTITPRA